MEHQLPDDVAIQVSVASVAAVDERSSTNDEEAELHVADGGAGDNKGLTRRTFSQAYKMKHRRPLVPGICIFCTDLMNGIPPIVFVCHYVQHMGSLSEQMVFFTVRLLLVRSVLPEERFLIDKIDPVGVYRCIVQYGYMNNHNIEGDVYVPSVIAPLKEIAETDDEITVMDSALTNRSTFVLGRTILKMSTGHNCFKRFAINNLYRFLQKNFRSNISNQKIAPGKTLQVGIL